MPSLRHSATIDASHAASGSADSSTLLLNPSSLSWHPLRTPHPFQMVFQQGLMPFCNLVSRFARFATLPHICDVMSAVHRHHCRSVRHECANTSTSFCFQDASFGAALLASQCKYIGRAQLFGAFASLSGLWTENQHDRCTKITHRHHWNLRKIVVVLTWTTSRSRF